jgi:eukaryotic-like serine/threonine-protein kinase
MSERLESGSIVDARYRIDHRLGSGGMAEVYCAEDLQLGRKVALKVLYRRFAEDEEFVERFRREASSAAGLQHQHVVAVYDRGEYDGTYYIAMEYLDGRSLKKIITDEAPLEPEYAIDLTQQILRAARFAHRRGIIHRDLKPHNVIVDDDDRAKVTDFGIARAGASDMTQTGSIMGTAQYLSPEQAQGHPVDERSDIYSIGVMLYEMLTARLPFDGESAVSIALKHVSEQPEPPSTYNREISVGLEAVVMRALAKDPAARFPDADAFYGALDAARTGDPNAAGLPPPDTTQFIGRVPVVPVATPVAADVAAAYGGADAPSGEYPPVTDDDDHGTRWWIWAAAAVAAVAVLVVIGVLMFSGGKTYPVPNVVNTSRAFAVTELRNAGFSSDSTTNPSSQPVGTVVGQDPPAGQKIEHGETVHLTISSGPLRQTVPPVTNLGRNKATQVLKQAGFATVNEVFKFSGDVTTNHVISVSPAEGQNVPTSFTITLTVSKGAEKVLVPDETGKTQSDAILDLHNAGLRYGLSQQASSEAPGTVLSQTPVSGTHVPKNAVVTLTVATTVDVPDVTGLTQLTARTQLKNAGFVASVTTVATSDKSQSFIVQSQKPTGGTAARKGATVSITVAMYQPSTTTTTQTTPPPTTTTPTTPTVATP